MTPLRGWRPPFPDDEPVVLGVPDVALVTGDPRLRRPISPGRASTGGDLYASVWVPILPAAWAHRPEGVTA